MSDHTNPLDGANSSQSVTWAIVKYELGNEGGVQIETQRLTLGGDGAAWTTSAAPSNAAPPASSGTASKCGYTLDELKKLLQKSPVQYVVEGLLPADDVHVAIGDSGLGKTPWAYQLGLCVAEGKPFLGHNVRKTRVLYYDMENGFPEIIDVSDAIRGHLGINGSPKDFIVIPNDGSPAAIETAVDEHKPGLVIVDTLRALHPEAEMDNPRMSLLFQKYRRIARENHCAILLLHHTRKPGEKGAPALEDTPIIQWLNEACGAKALINQANTRIALDRPASSGKDDVALVMKSHVKLRGEGGPYYLERICDGDGEPVGYSEIVGVGLLGNTEQEDAFGRLPEKFRFSEARKTYGRTDNPTREWLKKCEAVGLIKRTEKGKYEKVAQARRYAQGD